ncbi:MAG: hypothetical protein CME31_20070 [Gimesia sp.]|uniref:Double zinc ribbon n=1 Tax=Gimesia maris TaxID=122 RepID=A0A3D3QZT1_9PLAN|nr:hypothetical protein [Gimesia sp.]HCO22101.1 hypothetical protein [Gimesia maris]|tara:strand:+ start:101304 stop:103133 length:1830 start_codon:yes stop_codon:yes gene_type:complete
MPIKVRCKECNTSFSVKDEAEGKRVRCKECGAPVKVTAAKQSKKRSRSSKPADTDDFLATLDIDKLEDKAAKICPRCGQDVDEDDVECSHCGVDLSTGRMSEATRRKRKRKGPAVEEFYSKSWGDAFTFLKNHKGLAVKTFFYSFIASTLFFCAVFMMMWCHRTPPRAFWGFIAFVSIMAIPGWIWFIQTEVVRYALQKKDKLKRINFDFFLCSALGMKFIFWVVLFSLPAEAILGTLGYYFISNDSIPVGVILIAAGFIPTFLMFPLAMPHMTMVDSTPGWLIHKLGKVFLNLVKPAIFWCFVFVVTSLPVIGCLAAIGAVYGNGLNDFFSNVQYNSAIARDNGAKEYAEENKIKDFEEGPFVGKTPAEIDASILIAPSILWALACQFYAPSLIYNARVNGLLALHCKPDLGLITKLSETKYVSKADSQKNGAGPTPAQLAIYGVLGGIGVWLFSFVIIMAFASVAVAINMNLLIFALGLAAILFTPPLIAAVCWIMTLIELGKKDGAAKCVLGVFFAPYAYGKGWGYIKENKQMGKVMLVWTLIISYYVYAVAINFIFNQPLPGSERPENAPAEPPPPAAAGAEDPAMEGGPADPAMEAEPAEPATP